MAKVSSAGVVLDADVTVPARAQGVVLFAHGSGSSRLSPRNRSVAERLNGVGLATVLTDLLAAGALAETTAPVLLIVGERDERVLELNRAAAQELRTAVLRIVPGATHLFEEPGTLEEVAGAAAQWFERYLV